MHIIITLPLLLIHLSVSSQDGFTFMVDNVKTAEYLLVDTNYKKVFEQSINKPITVFPEISDAELIPVRNNGFLNTIHLSYAQHRPLELSPDDVWLSIMQGLSIHINQNIKDLEEVIFVDSKPSQIEIRNDTLVKLKAQDWANTINTLSADLKSHTKQNIYDFMVPTFSTSTPQIKVAYQATALKSVEKVVSYVFTSGCGIPSITLRGTLEDWNKILLNLEELKKYGMSEWVANLKPVIAEFIEARAGNPNVDFWKEIYKESQVYADTYISGWVLKFFPYVKDYTYFEDEYDYLKTYDYKPNEYINGKEYLLSKYTTDDFPPGFVRVNITWLNFFNTTKEIKSDLQLYAGFIGIRQNNETKAIRPEINWAICKVNGTLNLDYEETIRQSPVVWKRESHKRDPWVTKPRRKPEQLPIYNPAINNSYQAGIDEISQGIIDLGVDTSTTTRIQFVVAWSGDIVKLNIESDLKPEELDRIRVYLLNLPQKFKPAVVKAFEIREKYAKTNYEVVIRF